MQENIFHNIPRSLHIRFYDPSNFSSMKSLLPRHKLWRTILKTILKKEQASSNDIKKKEGLYVAQYLRGHDLRSPRIGCVVGVNDLCTRNCVAVQPSHFRMPLRFASRLSSTDLIAPLLPRNIFIYIYILLVSLRCREDIGENMKHEGKRSKLRSTFRGSKRRNASHAKHFHGLCNLVHSPLSNK